MSCVLKNNMKWMSPLPSCKFQGCIFFSIKSSGQKPSMLCILKSIQNSKCHLGISCERVFPLTTVYMILLHAGHDCREQIHRLLLACPFNCYYFWLPIEYFLNVKEAVIFTSTGKDEVPHVFRQVWEEKGKMLWDPSNTSLITPRSEEINGLIGTNHTAANL